MAKKIPLVKTSSLGDVIHALPAISDVQSATAAVIDAQGLFKSALIALAARGSRYGFDFHSSREPLALFYHRTFRISWQLHAVERNRLLLARALGYEVPQSCSYGISTAPRRFDWLSAGPYAVLLHATSGDYKLWREQNWGELGDALDSTGIDCVLPWGNPRERARSARIAASLPALSLDHLAGLFAGAQAVVGVDTGLTHLAAAVGVPTVGIYCGTDPAATGLYGCARAQNLGGVSRPPKVSEVMAAMERLI
jgi:lipopolysaccharide heptosyltransferase I